ncbi:ribosome maturation factor RimM [Indiicoccus explosivorum]|uniref:ribosome maturation factor RimM n=1 Tax=Indiicoccus explosivorum TaxID=1917864 RepID=UPI000B4545F2|nr:ribosome maturation factor RimM [Indiicoccus explosivorum]
MDWFNVGKIVNTHGIRGEVRVLSRTDFPEERFAEGARLGIFKEDAKKPVPVKVASHRKHKNFDLLTFEGYSSINQVEEFKNADLKVADHELDELEEHEYYYHEIIGCTVVTEDGREIGMVTDILETGANDVWAVKPETGKMQYIPYIEDVVKEIDVENKKIVIELMEGLLNE